MERPVTSRGGSELIQKGFLEILSFRLEVKIRKG